MSKYLVETFYTCTFKIVHKLDELNEKKLWQMKEFFKSDYIASKDVNAWLGLAQVIK